jgi:hypothetical protein
LDLFFNDELIIGHLTPEGGYGLGADDPRRFLDSRTVSAKIREWRESIGRPVKKMVGGRIDTTEEELGFNYDDPQLKSKLPSDHKRS